MRTGDQQLAVRLLDLELDGFGELVVQINVDLVVAGGKGLIRRETEIDWVRFFHAVDCFRRDLNCLFTNLFVLLPTCVNESTKPLSVSFRFSVRSKKPGLRCQLPMRFEKRIEKTCKLRARNAPAQLSR